MDRSLVILIDVWDSTCDPHVWSMIHRINKLEEEGKIEAALFATYCAPIIRPKNGKYAYHPWMKSKLNVYCEELVPENYYMYDQDTNDYLNDIDGYNENVKNEILLLEKGFNFDNIIMMGGRWKECLHDRSLGIYNLKRVLPHKKIIIYPECVCPLYNDYEKLKKGPFYV
jgi:hypothetical protein